MAENQQKKIIYRRKQANDLELKKTLKYYTC